MKLFPLYAAAIVSSLGLYATVNDTIKAPCWCWDPDRRISAARRPVHPGTEYATYGSYGVEADWTNPDRLIPLDYGQAQGQRIFYQQCVWCHADTTPAGPSNRNNVQPLPPLLNDGNVLNKESDASLVRIIAQGGAAIGKSPMMPPHEKLLSTEDLDNVVRFIRVIAVPQYHKP